MNEIEERELLLKEELLRRKVARFSFEEYCKYIDPRYRVIATQWWKNIHRLLIETLQDVALWKLKRLIMSLPPRTWKSELWGIKLPTRYVWRNPANEFVLASYDANLASDFGKKSRDIVQSQRFRNVFPDFRLAPDQNTKSHWETIAPDGWRWWMYTVWVWWALTGKWWSLLYIDDPIKNMKEAQSPVIQEAVWDWFDSVLSTRKQSEESAIVLTMTRWHSNDLAWKLIEKAKDWGEKYYELKIKAIDDEWYPIIWPGKWGPNYFFNERENRDPKVWHALFQQEPLKAMGNIFTPWDERFFLDSDFEKVWWWKKSDIDIWIFVDPAFSTNIKSCDAVVRVVWQHRITKNIFFFDCYADTSAPSKTINQIFFLASKWVMKWFNKPFISIERSTINKDQEKFIQDFYTEMQTRNEFYKVILYMPPPDKLWRIRDELEPMWTLNRLFFNQNIASETKRRILDQYYEFPNWKKVDIIDTDAQAVFQLTNWAWRTAIQEKDKPKEVIYDPITWLPMEKVYKSVI